MSLSVLNVAKLFVPWVVKVVYRCELLGAVVVVLNLWLRINRCRKLSVDDMDFFLNPIERLPCRDIFIHARLPLALAVRLRRIESR